jgi:hypothetical protein
MRFASSRPRQYAGNASCFDTYEAEYKKYLKKMWAAPVFSEERASYEKKANEAKRKQALCGEGGTTLFDAGASPQALWTMPYSKRRVDLSGLLGPEESIVAVAKGMNPGAMFALEDRAVIKGGLMALFAAGLSTYDPTPLKITTANLKKDDEAIIKAAGGKLTGNIPKDLSTAAEKVRKQVSAQGDGLKKAAWGLRGLYVLSTLVGFQVVSAAVTLGANFIPIPGVGQVVSAALAAKSGITSDIAENVKNQINGFIETGMTEYAVDAQEAAAKVPTKTPTKTTGAPRKTVSGGLQTGGGTSVLARVPTWGWVAGAAAVGGIAFVLLRPRR